jgi:hypothetical protein
MIGCVEIVKYQQVQFASSLAKAPLPELSPRHHRASSRVRRILVVVIDLRFGSLSFGRNLWSLVELAPILCLLWNLITSFLVHSSIPTMFFSLG